VALLLVGAWTVMVAGASAHDAGVAAITIARQPSDTWTFELQAPLSGLDRAMRRFHASRSRELDALDEDSTRYKELLVEYVKATFELEPGAAGGGGAPVPAPALGAGRIKLGEHVSVLIFAVENMPTELDTLTLRLPYMADEAGQRNVLWLVDGDRRDRHVLGEDGAFTVLATEFFKPELDE